MGNAIDEVECGSIHFLALFHRPRLARNDSKRRSSRYILLNIMIIIEQPAQDRCTKFGPVRA
jgi:hypothetical protein